MQSLSPSRSSRRGSSCAALLGIVSSLAASVAVAADPPPATQEGEATTQPESRRGPPLRSLDDVRLDRRMTLLNAGETLEPTARLPEDAASYVVELPSHKELILDLARRSGRPLPTVRLLPEESRTTHRYGIVTADHAILRKSPADVPGDRENLSDVTRGEPVWILDANEAKTSLLVHASDGYLGWVDAGSVWAVPKETFVSWTRYWGGRETRERREDFRLGFTEFDALIASRDAEALARLGAGLDLRTTGIMPRPLAVGVHAKLYLGTRYVWGGKTKDGIDCSGLAQAAIASVGVPLPRDADQQSLVGRLVATRWEQSALQPGDLLFYVSPRRGNVNHVAIYLGDGEYIEAAGRDVHVSSMTPGAANYDAKRAETFGWARRVIE